MKKQISAAILYTIILTSLTACGAITPRQAPPNDASESVSAVSGAALSAEEKTSEASKANNAPVKTANVPMAVYGETDIPEFSGSSFGEDGRLTLTAYADEDYSESCLDKMVFETHVVGDYTLRLTGETVRVNPDFPDRIFVREPRAEVEKNGVILERGASFGSYVIAVDQLNEYVLYKDKIGSYVDLYELDVPVIAVRYFYDGSAEIRSAVNFATIQNGEVCDGFAGVCVEGTGLEPDEDTSSKIPVKANGEKSVCRVALCAADEFKVLDGKTLADEAAGIKYTFDFREEPQFELFTADKLG